jgi:hypothetical protein
MLGELLSFGSGILGNMFASDRQDDAQDFSAQQFATRYQTTTKDMKAAGLNPMLAYSQGGGSPPSSSAASASMPDVGATHLQSKMTTAQVANVNADTENKAAQAKLIEAQAAQAWASAGQSSANVQKIDSEINKIKAETANLPDEGRKIRQTVQMLADQGALMAQQGETQVATRQHLLTMIKKLKSETELLNFDVDANKSLGNFGKESAQFKTVIDLIRALKGF